MITKIRIGFGSPLVLGMFVSIAASGNPLNPLLKFENVSIGAEKTVLIEPFSDKYGADFAKAVESFDTFVGGNDPHHYALEVIRPEFPKNPKVKRWSEVTWGTDPSPMLKSLRGAAFDKDERVVSFTDCTPEGCTTYTRSYCDALTSATSEALPNFGEAEQKFKECNDLTNSMTKIQRALAKHVEQDRNWRETAAFEVGVLNDYALRKAQGATKFSLVSEVQPSGNMQLGFNSVLKLKAKIERCQMLMRHFKPVASTTSSGSASKTTAK